jgi:uncharacterized membrane protein (UPF0182 family)
VVRGDVQLIPIGDSILYVRPIYVETTEGAAFPRFKYVAVTYGERAVLANSIPDAISTLFGAGTSTTVNPTPTPTPPATGTVADLLDRAQKQFDAANAALKKGDLATYAKDIKAAEDDVAAAVKALAAVTKPTTPTTAPASTTTTTLPPA